MLQLGFFSDEKLIFWWNFNVKCRGCCLKHFSHIYQVITFLCHSVFKFLMKIILFSYLLRKKGILSSGRPELPFRRYLHLNCLVNLRKHAFFENLSNEKYRSLQFRLKSFFRLIRWCRKRKKHSIDKAFTWWKSIMQIWKLKKKTVFYIFIIQSVR